MRSHVILAVIVSVSAVVPLLEAVALADGQDTELAKL